MRIFVRLYGDLAHARSPAAAPPLITRDIQAREPVGAILESLEVALCDIDLLLANGKAVGFDYHPGENDRISVYPRFQCIDISPLHLINRGALH